MRRAYSFAASPTKLGYHVLARVDETTYSPEWIFGDLRMGEDHPVIWWHCQCGGRTFYSALGHQAESYSDPTFQGILRRAIDWTLAQDGKECSDEIARPTGSSKPA
jgi:uncharacterized protein